MALTLNKVFDPLLADYKLPFQDIISLKDKAQQYLTMLQAGQIDKDQYAGLIDDLKDLDDTMKLAQQIKNKAIIEEVFDGLRQLASLVA